MRHDLAMKRISVQDLEAQLSGAIAEAEGGATLLITRHNKPVAQLGPAISAHLHAGARNAAHRLTPAVAEGTGGRYLAVLLDDRGAR
jgi:antitoxin (DNA-binding transcriptional repressor) of toxin-antitoxin stability system